MITTQQLQAYRTQGDLLADSAVASLFANPAKVGAWQKALRGLRGNATAIPADFPEEVHAFFRESAQLPSWADHSLMQEGAKVFAFYSKDMMSLLGHYSLPYCYASAYGVQVLHRSERMGYDTAKRLLETGNFIFDVLKLDAFQPHGFGIRSIQQVRLLHASIRYHLLQKGDWPDAYGLPINQEDMLGTNLAFSLIVLRGLRKLGHSVSAGQTAAYMHLWAVIGYCMGIDEDLIPQTAKEAYWLEKKTVARNFRPSEEGQLLAKALLESMEQLSPPFLPKGFSLALMKHLLGEELSEILDIPQPNWTSNLLGFRKILNQVSFFWQAPELADYQEKVAYAQSLTPTDIQVPAGYTIAKF